MTLFHVKDLFFFQPEKHSQRMDRNLLMMSSGRPAVVNFINILPAAFTRRNPESAKKADNLTVFI